MKTIKQVIRQPLKSFAGVIMVALAVAILVTCVGQYAATSLTRTNLDDRYDTVAIVSDEYFWERGPGYMKHTYKLSDEIQSWVTDTVQSRLDLVKTESYTALYSAYAPGLVADNFSRFENGDALIDQAGVYNENAAYRGAMLDVTLTKVGTVLDEDTSEFSTETGESQVMLNHTTMLCVGTVNKVIGMEEGFRSPVGKEILLTITAYSRQELETLNLCIGERYLVYGMDYSDLQGTALETTIINFEAGFDELYGIPFYDEYGRSNIDSIARQIDCYMTVCDYSALPWNYVTDGSFVTLTDQRKYYTRDENGIQMTAVSAEEYIPNYCVPTIVKLDGSTEDFLKSADGTLWHTTLEEMEISHHGFPVLAVDKLGYQVTFAREQARIVDGRDFTESERSDGSRVCIISETVATANGLKVGDTINLQTYGYDLNINVQQKELRQSTSFPSAAVYSRAIGFTSDMESYTIVGLYRQNNAWQNQGDPYGITPNTIFVPKASITGEALVGKSGIFYTMVLQNGMLDAFRQYQEEAGYPDLFICMDQGYGEIVAGLDAYEGVSSNALKIGIAGCTVILILFLLLFPAQHGKTLATMSSLGAPRGKRIIHIVISTVCLLIPGAATGGLAGSLLWERVAATLMESVNVQIPLESNMAVLAPILALGITALMVVISFMVSIMVSGSKGLMRRK